MRFVRVICCAVLVLAVPTGAAARPTARGLARALMRDNATLLRRNRAGFAEKAELLAASPFVYYRAAAGRFYALLQRGLHRTARYRSLTRILINGDPHINGNTGLMRGKRWGLVDHDEAGHPAPFTVDPLRWASGVFLAAAEHGVSEAHAKAMVERFLRAYVDGLTRHPRRDKPPKPIRKLVRKARHRSRRAYLDDNLDEGGAFRLKSGTKRISGGERAELVAAAGRWIAALPAKQRAKLGHYEVADVVDRVGRGGGSRGLRRIRVSLVREGGGHDRRRGAIIVEFKEQPPSPARVFGASPVSSDDAQRVIGMRARQGAGRKLDGAVVHRGISYTVVEKRPDEVELDAAQITSKKFRRALARADGKAMAYAHARSGIGVDAATTARAILADISGASGFGGANTFVAELTAQALRTARSMREQHRVYVGSDQTPGALQLIRQHLGQ